MESEVSLELEKVNRLTDWYRDNQIISKGFEDPEVQKVTHKLGLHFLRLDRTGTSLHFVFNLIDERLFFLAKIKHGL